MGLMGYLNTLLSALTGDVTITSPANLDILQYQTSSTKWVNRQPLGTETSVTLNSAAANDTVIGANAMRFTFTTMPSTAPFFYITGIEWKNGTVVNGNTHAWVSTVDAVAYPSSVYTTLMAWGSLVQAGASSVQRLGPTQLTSHLVPAGSLLGVSIATGSATGRYATATVASANNDKAFTVTSDAPAGTGGAWVATTEEPYIKLYYKPVMGV